MKRIAITLISIVFISSACSNAKTEEKDVFSSSMRSGKDALIAGDYQRAVEQFEIALIEKPTDTDAQILHEKAKNSLAEHESNQQEEQIYKEAAKSISEYERDVKELAKDIKTFIDKFDVNKIEATELRNTWNSLNKRMSALQSKEWYSNEAIFNSVHKHLVDAMDNIDETLKTYEETKTISKYVLERYKILYSFWEHAFEKAESYK